MSRRVAAAVLLSLTALVPPAPRAAAAATLVPPPGYYRPAVVDGMAFPVARSNFFSVLEFDNGWHDPRFRLIDGRWQLVGIHEGIDIGAEKGTPIVSATSGEIERVGWTFYSGTRVGVRGTDGRYYLYAHLSSVAPGIAPGAGVEAGDVLGRVGNTGYGGPGHEDEFPPHLHFGIEGPSGWENPYPMLVELYRQAVLAGRAADRRLAALADGPRGPWEREVERTFLGIPPP